MKRKIKRFNETTKLVRDSSLTNSDDTNSEATKKLELYKSTLSLLITELPNDDIILKYLNDDDGHEDLIDFICEHIKPEIHWSTCVGILDACDLIIGEAIGNDNI